MLEAIAIADALLIAQLPSLPDTRPKYEYVDDHFVIHRDQGGDLEGYALYFSLMKRSGEVVKVEDACISACTMVLNNPKACAMPGAHFGFHQARRYNKSSLDLLDVSEPGNKLLWEHYPRTGEGKARPTHPLHGLH